MGVHCDEFLPHAVMSFFARLSDSVPLGHWKDFGRADYFAKAILPGIHILSYSPMEPGGPAIAVYA